MVWLIARPRTLHIQPAVFRQNFAKISSGPQVGQEWWREELWKNSVRSLLNVQRVTIPGKVNWQNLNVIRWWLTVGTGQRWHTAWIKMVTLAMQCIQQKPVSTLSFGIVASFGLTFLQKVRGIEGGWVIRLGSRFLSFFCRFQHCIPHQNSGTLRATIIATYYLHHCNT